jgi:NAD(P)-dependent dehydrogenase (short-subunit alcohol dehydrogenase family)
MVNNAGVVAVGSAVDEDDAVTRRVLDVNIYGVILGTKLAAQRMLPRRKGHIINIASLGGVLPTEGIATYCATKHAVLGYTDTVRMENRARGIHFSAIMPTLTKYRDDRRRRTRAGLQECRARGRGPGSRRRDCQAETTCARSPVDRRRRVGPPFHAATHIGGAWPPTGYRARIHQRRRAGQTRIICPAHGDVLRLLHRRLGIRRLRTVGFLCTASGFGRAESNVSSRFQADAKTVATEVISDGRSSY